MQKSLTDMITAQAAGAFGEKAVEAELLRRNWIPANVNPTVKNARQFDIYARKNSNRQGGLVQIRVKTCRPGMRAFILGGFKPGQPVATSGISKTDFTVVVRMGNKGKSDQFYVLPTSVLLREVAKRQREQTPKFRLGRKDIGMYRIGFDERRDGRAEAGRGVGKKWSRYLNNWELLDRASPEN